MEANNIGKKISNRRVELSLTQKQVADYVGVTEATVSRWESGEIENMRRDKIAKLANILKVSPLLIMGISDEPIQKQPDLEELQLISNFRRLTADCKKSLMVIVNQMVNPPMGAAV